MNEPHEVARHARASELFVELRELPREQREAALLAATAGDVELRDEVRSLLEHDTRDALDPEGRLALPERIGPYRILRSIGRGGSGQVFLAEQEQPVRRRVAIKVVPAAAHDPELAARLHVERRALERAEHPNVARILDTGRTESGLPFLVMDYIEGPTIAEYCAAARSTPVECVRLTLPLVDAVQHAHQRGVVHRDLKPANLLVAEVDGRPSPRVLDFGIAKPIDGLFGEESPQTLGLPIGTLAYMAPEQTGTQPIDTRADVYSLGAVLYELVAGRVPIEIGDDLVGALQRIRDLVPPPASRVRADRTTSRALAQDLDRVLAKALEKDPERRYATMAAFGADLERVLARLPVEARPPTLAYRTARFVERNRALSLAAVLALLALALGFGGLALGLREARAQRLLAEQNRDAEAGLNRFLIEDILLAASPDRAGPATTAVELLRRASAGIEARLAQKPLTAAAQHQALADAFMELGLFDESRPHAERALELRRAAAGPASAVALRSEIVVGGLLVRLGQNAQAEVRLRAALEPARTAIGPEEDDLYKGLNDLGMALLALGRASEARASLEESLAGRERILGATHAHTITTRANLALVLPLCGDDPAAERALQRALSDLDHLPEPAPRTELMVCSNFAVFLMARDRSREARPHLERAAALADDVLGTGSSDWLVIQGNLAGLESELGEPERAAERYAELAERLEDLRGPGDEATLETRHGTWSAVRRTGRLDEALDGFAQLLDDVTHHLGAEHPLEAKTRASLAYVLVEAGLHGDALPHAERAVERLEALYGADSPRSVNARATRDRAAAAR